MGPDRPIHLRLYSSRIKEVHTAARVDGDLKRSLKVDVEAEGHEKGIRVELSSLDGKVGLSSLPLVYLIASHFAGYVGSC